jgi:hypothetical protein
MKTFLNNLFVGLGVVFLVVLIFGGYFIISDPYNLRPLLFGGGSARSSVNANSGSDQNTGLSAEQERALEAFGVDPSSIPSPSSITPEQEACFEEKLGKERVAEIKAGASPTAAEFFQAKDCV